MKAAKSAALNSFVTGLLFYATQGGASTWHWWVSWRRRSLSSFQ
jgi:hypothetical protein